MLSHFYLCDLAYLQQKTATKHCSVAVFMCVLTWDMALTYLYAPIDSPHWYDSIQPVDTKELWVCPCFPAHILNSRPVCNSAMQPNHAVSSIYLPANPVAYTNNLTYSHHLIPTVFEVGDSRIQTSHAIPASRI